MRQLQKQARHRLKQPRRQALYLVASGQARSRHEVAALVGVSRNSVARCLDLYAAGGLPAVVTVQPSPGSAPALTGEQLRRLWAALARPEGCGAYGEVQGWIAQEVGGEMKSQAVYRRVHEQLRARLTVPRPSPPKKTSKR